MPLKKVAQIKKKRNTTATIKLKKGDAAIVMGEKTGLDFYMPWPETKKGEDSEISGHTWLLAGISFLIGEEDPRLLKLVDKKFREKEVKMEKREPTEKVKKVPKKKRQAQKSHT